MSLCILDPRAGESGSANVNTSDTAVELALRSLAKNWFGMRTFKSKSMANQSADFFVYAEPPPISYLLRYHGHTAAAKEVPLIIMATNAFESASLTANGINQLTDLGRILEIISQPCGPHKLARALHRCLSRSRSLEQSTKDASKDQPFELKVSDSPGTVPKEETPLIPFDQQTGRVESSSKRAQNPFDNSRQIYCPSSTNGPRSSHLPNGAPVGPSNKGLSLSSLCRETESVESKARSTATENQTPVLLVEDNDVNLRLLVAFMKKSNLPYVIAKDGLQATQAYELSIKGGEEGRRFKYVVMDISMPVMDGIEATRIIR